MKKDSSCKAVALIFAGGQGIRMNNSGKPKQFLELKGKPILIYTLEHFEKHEDIDGIIVACLEEWIPYLESLLQIHNITKVVKIVPGGLTGQDSIFNAIQTAHELYPANSIVLIHDGVRPLIDHKTITDNIECVKEHGSCITCVPTIETFVVRQPEGNFMIPERKDSLIARAPQSFRLEDIYNVHCKARAEGRHDFIDSCSIMNNYGYQLATVIGPTENIKITTPMDYFIFKTMFEVNETKAVFGL